MTPEDLRERLSEAARTPRPSEAPILLIRRRGRLRQQRRRAAAGGALAAACALALMIGNVAPALPSSVDPPPQAAIATTPTPKVEFPQHTGQLRLVKELTYRLGQTDVIPEFPEDGRSLAISVRCTARNAAELRVVIMSGSADRPRPCSSQPSAPTPPGPYLPRITIVDAYIAKFAPRAPGITDPTAQLRIAVYEYR